MSCIPWQRPVFTCIRQTIKWSLSHALLYSFIVFKYVIFILRKDKIWLIFLGIWGEAALFLGIWGAKANTFRETMKLFAGRWGDECIIFRDQWSTDPPPMGGLNMPHCCGSYECRYMRWARPLIDPILVAHICRQNYFFEWLGLLTSFFLCSPISVTPV